MRGLPQAPGDVSVASLILLTVAPRGRGTSASLHSYAGVASVLPPLEVELTHTHPMQCRLQCCLHQDWLHNQYCGKIILCGSKGTHIRLWMIPLCPTPPLTASNNPANPLPTVIAANVDATSHATYTRPCALLWQLHLYRPSNVAGNLQPSLASQCILSTPTCLIHQLTMRAT